jgi:SAM-dependent methyltransferase
MSASLRERVAGNPHWYHTIELAPGVVTPGHVDLRTVAPRVLPADLAGRRALDVGTFDGFWAFELERRGAEAVAIDVDKVTAAEWPPLQRARLEARAAEWAVEVGHGFRIAADALGSNARRVPCSVYDLEPEAIGGPVDVAFVGALLLHLRDPVRALERVRGALAPGGRAIVLEIVDPLLSLLAPRRPVARFMAARSEFSWWHPNVAGLREWVIAAGFTEVRRLGLHRPPAERGMQGQTYCALSASG